MDRKSTNYLTGVLTCALLLIAMGMSSSSGELTSGIQKMTKNINRALMEVLATIDEIDYTKMNSTATYNSTTAFNPKGMAMLYNFTHIFIKALIPEIVPPEDLVIFKKKDIVPEIKDNDYLAVVKYYMNFVIFISALLVFAIFMPLCGFCFCCCRCCCSSDDRFSKASQKHQDLCKKIFYATIMIALGTLFLFGVVCAFASNEHMEEGTQKLTENLRLAIDDTNIYMKDTKKHVNILLDKNFEELSDAVVKSLDKSSDILYVELKNITNAVSIDDALEVAEGMDKVKDNLLQIKELTNVLRVDASQLNDAMRKVKKELLGILQKCDRIQQCRDLKSNYVAKLGTDIDFNSIPDLQMQLDDLNGFINSQAKEHILEGKKKLDSISDEINKRLKPEIATIKNTIAEAGEEVRKQSKDVNSMLDETLERLTYESNRHLSTADRYIKEYSKYRYYVGIGVSCVFLLIALLIALGLICGVCGKKPSIYDDDCCNKGTGSSFLMFGVAIMFLTSTILVIILIVYMLGMFPQLLVCEPLRKPHDNKVIRFIDAHFDLKEYIEVDTTVARMLDNCYKNKTIYEVFNLKSKIDLDKVQNYMDEFKIDEKLAKIEETLKEDVGKISGELVDPATLEKLRNLSNLEIDFDKIIGELNISFTTVNLDEFNQSLNLLIKEVEKHPEAYADLAIELRNTALAVDAYIKKLYNPMKDRATLVIALAKETQEQLKFNKNSFKEAILALISDIEDAQTQLSGDQGVSKLTVIAKEFAEAIKNSVQYYLDMVVGDFRNNVGKCGPLVLIMNGTLTTTCDKIIAPMTGFGLSILWCITLFIPIIIFSTKLSTLYRKTDGPNNTYIETEYLYDAYADRESIPLARGKHGKKKHKKKRYEGRNYMETCPDPGREYPGGSQHPDARYADMAPKHFEDYPNGGPPQYQRTEYERPPPYYYPGSGDQR